MIKCALHRVLLLRKTILFFETIVISYFDNCLYPLVTISILWLLSLSATLLNIQTQNAQEVQKYQNEILDLKRGFEAFQHKTNNEHANNDLKSKYEAIQKSLQDSKTHIKVLEQKLMAKNSEVRNFELENFSNKRMCYSCFISSWQLIQKNIMFSDDHSSRYCTS